MNIYEATVELWTNVKLGDILDALSSLSNDALFEVIKMIDKEVADYDFTNKLAEYFAEEMKKENKLFDEKEKDDEIV